MNPAHSLYIKGPVSLQFERRGFATAAPVARPASPAQMASAGLPLRYRAVDAYLAEAIPMAPLTIAAGMVGLGWMGDATNVLKLFITLGKASKIPQQGYVGHVGGVPVAGNRIVRSVL